jgi:glycosyltransferase involved in cell wall biosynthesis
MRPLVIGVDARELLGDATGVGRYLGELMRRWTTRSDAADRQFLLYSPEHLSVRYPEGTAEVRILPGGRGTWWEQTALARGVRADRPDVFFAPAYTAPAWLPMPFAVTIHDVSFSRHPEWFRPREGTRRRLLTRRAARRAAVVLTVSRFSRQEIHDLYEVPLERIRVVPNGVTHQRSAHPPPREPLVLYTGSIFNRRRVPDLLAAFARVVRTVPSARLAIVGDNRTWPHEDLTRVAEGFGLSDRVTFLPYLSGEPLAELYARASAFVFLSEYEGFGLTPLEALSAGTPIVVLDTPVAREVYGDAAVFVARGDIDGTAGAIARFLLNRDTAVSQLGRAASVLARYSWDGAADSILPELEGIARR